MLDTRIPVGIYLAMLLVISLAGAAIVSPTSSHARGIHQGGGSAGQ